jgi:hypothetical protein
MRRSPVKLTACARPGLRGEYESCTCKMHGRFSRLTHQRGLSCLLMYLCLHRRLHAVHHLPGCSLTVHAIARGVSSYHACLERSMSTSYQVSAVGLLLTNPNALCMTAGMEYISACVSTLLIHDTTSACIIVQKIVVPSPHGPVSIWAPR